MHKLQKYSLYSYLLLLVLESCCYGSQREAEKDPFMPIESVCRLFKGKIDFLIQKFEALGVWNVLQNLSPANARYEAAQETLEAVERIKEAMT